MNGAKYVVNSGNTKMAGSKPVDATYLSIKYTCPKTCPLKGEGCYGDCYPLCLHIKRLDKEADGLSILQIARAEAKVINESYKGGRIPNGRNLRIHVTGDSRTIAGTKLINSACGNWLDRGNNSNHIWSYTHCWDYILRNQWDNVSMLASVDSIDQVIYARQNGYAPAIVVAEHLSNKSYYIKGSDVKWLACPAQTRDNVACSDCLLCTKANHLYDKNMGISFAAHGLRKEIIKRRLK